MSFANQVAIITGASSGIGAALARALAATGCKVGLVARRREHLATLAEHIREAGGTAAIAQADVGDRAQVGTAIRGLRDQLGPVDLFIANAGVSRLTRLDPVNVEDQELMYRVNVFGVIYAIDVVLPEMLQRGRGHLVAVSSVAAYKCFPERSGYCSSKAAINSYMDGLRIHLRDRGIAVTTICPGFVRTEMTAANRFPMPWLLDADEAARQILNAVRRRRKVYTFPWQMALLMQALYWVPDWLLARGVRRVGIRH